MGDAVVNAKLGEWLDLLRCGLSNCASVVYVSDINLILCRLFCSMFFLPSSRDNLVQFKTVFGCLQYRL